MTYVIFIILVLFQIKVALTFSMSKIKGVTNSLSQQRCELNMLDIYTRGYTDPHTASDSSIDFDACTIRSYSNLNIATIESPIFSVFCSGTGEVLYGDMCGKLLR